MNVSSITLPQYEHPWRRGAPYAPGQLSRLRHSKAAASSGIIASKKTFLFLLPTTPSQFTQHCWPLGTENSLPLAENRCNQKGICHHLWASGGREQLAGGVGCLCSADRAQLWGRGDPWWPQRLPLSTPQLAGGAGSQALTLFMIQSASSMALLIICWILSGLSSSE